MKGKLPLVHYSKAQGTLLAWLDVSEVIDKVGAARMAAEASTDQRQVTPESILGRWLGENAKAHMNPGSSTRGTDHMRMKIGTTRRLLKPALDNIASAIDRV